MAVGFNRHSSIYNKTMKMSKESARIHSKILTESQIKEQQEIDKIITEELGINDEVSRISYYLTK